MVDKKGSGSAPAPEEQMPGPNTSPVTDSAFVDADALTEIFADSKAHKANRILKQDEDESSIPEDIMRVFEEHGLARRSYQTILKAIPSGGSDGNSDYVKGWKNTVPSIEWIAKNYGPGSYKLIFSWRQKNEDNLAKTYTDSIDVTISEKYRPTYRKFQLKQRIADAEEENQLLREAKLDNILERDVGSKTVTPSGQSAKEYVNEVLDFAGKLGLVKQDQPSFSFEKMLGLLIPSLPVIIKYLDDRAARERERSERFMAMMIQSTQNSANALVELVKNQQGPSRGSDMIEEMGKMVMGAMDIKAALSGEKESTVDKIMGMVEKFAPLIMSIAAMPRAARAAVPGVQAAKDYIGNDPAFQQVLNSPTEKIALIRKLDGHYGWEQTDKILSVMELERPAECPRIPTQQHPDMGEGEDDGSEE